MKDLILKWWFRRWSDWEFDGESHVYDNDYSKRPCARYHIYKSTSNDGLVRFKRIRR